MIRPMLAGLAGPAAEQLRTLLRIIYRRLPPAVRPPPDKFDRFDRIALRLGASPEATASMRAGHRVRFDLRARFQARAFYTGTFDDPGIAAACGLLDRPGVVAVDAGANVGLWTIPLARRAAQTSARVLAIEPVPANVARLRANLALNRVASAVDIEQLALADQPGNSVITLREDFAAGSETGNAALLLDDHPDDRFKTIPVRLDTLDNVIQRHGNPHVRLIKADVEGCEDLLLIGATGTFERCRPIAFFEWNARYYKRRNIDPTETTTPILSTLGYRCLRQEHGRSISQNRFWSPQPIDGIVLVPQETAHTIQKLLATTLVATTASGRSLLAPR